MNLTISSLTPDELRDRTAARLAASREASRDEPATGPATVSALGDSDVLGNAKPVSVPFRVVASGTGFMLTIKSQAILIPADIATEIAAALAKAAGGTN